MEPHKKRKIMESVQSRSRVEVTFQEPSDFQPTHNFFKVIVKCSEKILVIQKERLLTLPGIEVEGTSSTTGVDELLEDVLLEEAAIRVTKDRFTPLPPLHLRHYRERGMPLDIRIYHYVLTLDHFPPLSRGIQLVRPQPKWLLLEEIRYEKGVPGLYECLSTTLQMVGPPDMQVFDFA